MEKQKLDKISSVHWKKLINNPKVSQLLDDHNVYRIEILPCSPPEPHHDYEAHFYWDRKAKEHFSGIFKHELNCTWVEGLIK